MKKIQLIEMVGQMNYKIGVFEAKNKTAALKQYEDHLSNQGHSISESKRRQILKMSFVL
jgi:hypothetical protein